MPNNKTLAPPTPRQIIDGFIALALNRTMVKLDPRLYCPESFKQDRNRIRRDTAAFNKVWSNIRWRNEGDLSQALLKASHGDRLCYESDRGEWEYTTGQYTPTEIRGAASRVAKTAERILGHR